jgi:hypothetical protein
LSWTVPGIGTHDSNGRYQQAIAPGGIGRQESSPPIQPDVSIGMPVPQGLSGLILLSVIHSGTSSGGTIDISREVWFVPATVDEPMVYLLDKRVGLIQLPMFREFLRMALSAVVVVGAAKEAVNCSF